MTKDEILKIKELIENIIRVTWGEGWNYSLDWKVKAEQFLKETDKGQTERKLRKQKRKYGNY